MENNFDRKLSFSKHNFLINHGFVQQGTSSTYTNIVNERKPSGFKHVQNNIVVNLETEILQVYTLVTVDNQTQYEIPITEKHAFSEIKVQEIYKTFNESNIKLLLKPGVVVQDINGNLWVITHGPNPNKFYYVLGLSAKVNNTVTEINESGLTFIYSTLTEFFNNK